MFELIYRRDSILGKTIDSTVALNNGVEMPWFGLGVFQSGKGKETYNAVRWALDAGYRHIDTARIYRNERDVGKAVRDSGLPREDIFVTTKLWNDDQGYDKALKAFDKSLERLDLGYIDLYLVHFPVRDIRHETWRAMERIAGDERCRAVGVSNYMIEHLEQLLERSDLVPAVNQVEFSPFLYLEDLLSYCREKAIQLEGYSPLAKARRLDNPTVVSVAEKHGKTPAQVMIRWGLEHDVVTIPKSANRQRIEANADVFDFALDAGDVEQLNALHADFRTAWDPTGVP